MTTIGTSLVITGEVTSKEDITIHGQVKGQISMLEGTLLVAPTARIFVPGQRRLRRPGLAAGHRDGVAPATARAHPLAAGERVPRCIRPLDR